KRLEIARPRDGKPFDAHAAFGRDAGRIGVLPRHVVARAGREDDDVVAGGEAFGELAAVHLRAAGDAGAVALDDEGEFHASAGPRRTSRQRWSSRSSRRSRVVSIANSWTQANSTWLIRRCRSKLSR